VAIIDYGMGNLYSVHHACRTVGLDATVTERGAEILSADAVILPGVGAFGSAMSNLRRKGLASVLREVADGGTPLVGICLGMQLMMSESSEFGCHTGLGFVPGRVVRLHEPREGDRVLKVPHVGWRRVRQGKPWERGSLLAGLGDGQFMYFVHSFHCVPDDAGVIEAVADYGDTRFCAGIRRDNLTGFQFHPERSGAAGLAVYRNLKTAALARRGSVPT
jgi:glutamine amidotransferase